jgi:thiopeptide-type bacteriocin biosynthesis protein
LSGPNSPLLTRLVLDALRHPGRTPPDPARLGLTPEAVQQATDLFVDAGTRALLATVVSPRWVSWGIALRGRQLGLFARELHSALRGWLKRGLFTRFYFMQKPPGVRLRLESRHPERTRDVVERWLRSRRSIRTLTALPYEPESYQFGGQAGMEIAHTHFHDDSLAALRMLDGAARGTLSAGLDGPAALCALDLVRRVGDDPWERWDLWRGLELTGRLFDAPSTTVAACARTVEPWLLHPHQCLQALQSWERRVLRKAMDGNARTIRALRAAAARGSLLFAPRQIVPFWIIFDWNRWGLSSRAQAVIAIGAEHLLSPKRLLARGARSP